MLTFVAIFSLACIEIQKNAACQEFTIQGGSHTEENPADLDNEELSIRASKLMTQTKITSLYSSKFLKANNVSDKNMFKSEGNMSKEFACVENEIRRTQDKKHPVYLGVEKDEKHCGSLQNAKRKHTGFRSPICEHANSPSSNDEADAPANEFVTARIKLVYALVKLCTSYLCCHIGSIFSIPCLINVLDDFSLFFQENAHIIYHLNFTKGRGLFPT